MDIVIGTRGSKLAIAQSLEVQELLLRYYPNFNTKITTIKTTGDLKTDIPLADIGGKGLFLKEIENELLKNNIDIAVHSLKDVPAFFSNELIIPCILKRSSPYDAFISLNYDNLESLPNNATIATSSIRRKVQIHNFNPLINVIPLRGNINTRLDKIKNFDAIILAEAGMIRINKGHLITQVLSQKLMLSAVGQGAICIQCRANDKKIIDIIKKLNDKDSYMTTLAERSFMQAINGSCITPLAAFSHIKDNKLHLHCMLSDEKRLVFTERIANCTNDEAFEIGQDAGLELKNKLWS